MKTITHTILNLQIITKYQNFISLILLQYSLLYLQHNHFQIKFSIMFVEKDFKNTLK